MNIHADCICLDVYLQLYNTHNTQLLVGGIPTPLKNMSCQLGSFFPTEWNIKFHGSKAPSSTHPSQGKGWFFNVSCPPQRRCHPNPPTSGAWPSPQSWPWNRGTVEPGRPLGEPRPKHVDVANVAATIHHSVHVQVLHQPGAANVGVVCHIIPWREDKWLLVKTLAPSETPK